MVGRAIKRQDKGVSQRPFLKWAGGKRSLIESMRPHLPKSFGRYYEPFTGSGALFFALQPRRATLADNNRRLIRTFQGLRDDPESIIELLSSYPHDRDFFYELRGLDVDAASDIEVAAWFIYLNRTGFNGLYRVNSKNGFNVPFGDYKRLTICNAVQLRACSNALRRVSLRNCDFAAAARPARRGDLVYFDPPYVPLSATSSFTAYTKDGFSMDDQRRLRDLALRLKRRGVHVLISNSSADAVRELYSKGFKLVEIMARRAINSRGSGRGEVAELLIK